MASGGRYGVAVRAAQASDVGELCRLLVQVDPAVSAASMAGRVDALRLRPDSAVLVAAGYAGLSGMAALTASPSLRYDRPVARLLALVVDREEQRRGVGRLLLKAVSHAGRSLGCEVLEMGPVGESAEAFCRATGFGADGVRFSRALRRRGGDWVP